MACKFAVGDCVELAGALVDELYLHADQERLIRALEAAGFCAIVRSINEDIITLSPVGDTSVAMALSLRQVASLLKVVPEPSATAKGGNGFDGAPPFISQAFTIMTMFMECKDAAVEQACQIYRHSKNQQMSESEYSVADAGDMQPFEIRLGAAEQRLLETSTHVLEQYLRSASAKFHKRKPAKPTALYNIFLDAPAEHGSQFGAMHALVASAARKARSVKPAKIGRAAKANRSPDSPPSKPLTDV